MSFTDIFPLENKQSLPKQSQAVSLKNSTDFYFPLKFREDKAEKWRERNKHL